MSAKKGNLDPQAQQIQFIEIQRAQNISTHFTMLESVSHVSSFVDISINSFKEISHLKESILDLDDSKLAESHINDFLKYGPKDEDVKATKLFLKRFWTYLL